MELASSDLGLFAEGLAETLDDVLERWREANTRPTPDESDPEVIREAFGQLLSILAAYADKERGSGGDVTELGDYGLSMLLDLERVSAGLGLSDARGRLERLSVMLALWIARHEGELLTLELLVNGLAKAANGLRKQGDLERLFFTIEEIAGAVAPARQQEAAAIGNDPRQSPWALLLMNRAIVATRAHSPPLMDRAFSDILEQLPGVAPDFFTEALGQVPLRGYPPPVAEVITRFHQLAMAPKTLH